MMLRELAKDQIVLTKGASNEQSDGIRYYSGLQS